MSSFLRSLFTTSKSHDITNKDAVITIGAPINLTHIVHVEFDKEKKGFIGLPEEWCKLLEDNKIK